MRRRIAVLTLAVGLLVALAPAPAAEAAWAGGAFATCSADYPFTKCWSTRGVMASIDVVDVVLGQPLTQTSQYVGSVYVRKNVDNFCEFGWVQTRFPFGYGDKDMFILCKYLGVEALHWMDLNPGSLPNGEYRFEIYQNAGTPDVFRFRWAYGGVWTNTGQTFTFPNAPWTGAAVTADETTDVDDIDYHEFSNVWMENSLYVWKPANSDYNTHLYYIEYSETCCTSGLRVNQGQTGDDVLIDIG